METVKNIKELPKEALLKELEDYEVVTKTAIERYEGPKENGVHFHKNYDLERIERKPGNRHPFFRVAQYGFAQERNLNKFQPWPVFSLENYIPGESIDFLVAKLVSNNPPGIEDSELLVSSMENLYANCKQRKDISQVSLSISSAQRKASLAFEPIFYGELKPAYESDDFGLGRSLSLNFKGIDLVSGKEFSGYELQRIKCKLGTLRFLEMDGKSMI